MSKYSNYDKHQFTKWLRSLERTAGLCELSGQWFMLVTDDNLFNMRLVTEEYTELPEDYEIKTEPFYTGFVNDGVIVL